MASFAALLQTLGGAASNAATAKQQNTEEALHKKQIYSQLEDAAMRREHLRRVIQQMTANPQAKQIADIEDAIHRKLTDVEKQRMFGIAPKEFSPLTGRKIAYTTVPDPDNPGMGIKRAYDATTGEVLSEEPTFVASLAPTESRKFKQVTDLQGNTYLVPVTESSGKVIPGAGKSPAGPLGRKPSDSTASPTAAKPATARGTIATNPTARTAADGSPLPRGAVRVGHKPLSVAERRTLGDVQQITSRINQTLSMFELNPKLKKDNSPITPFVDWMEYSRGHFAPSDPVRLRLIQAAAFLSVKGAAPFAGLGRGKYVLENVQKHLPLPNDSPKLFYEKLRFLRDASVDARKALLDPFAEPEGASAAPEATGGTINGKPVGGK